MSSPTHSIRVAIGSSTGPPAAGPSPAGAGASPLPPSQTPPIDIHEGPEGLILEADLPGVAEDAVVIQLEDNVLNLRAQPLVLAPEGSRILHEEVPPLPFHRQFILSDEVDRSAITAELRQGVLRITLPKAERAKTRRIEIRSSQ